MKLITLALLFCLACYADTRGLHPICMDGRIPPCINSDDRSVLVYCTGFCDQVNLKVKSYTWDRADGRIACECECEEKR